ncbi:MAG: isocitrate lyase/phosphoenolpyruvate mutase family protein [Actinobacteria bacterium]|nr:isocitrate lyase/phosphoenolpyruvate mutase family protein [Actinomycetota bacterium]
MTSNQDKAQRFLELHHGPEPLLIPNPWDTGSAKLLAALGFAALATTSSGFAATMGRGDGSVTRDEALAHATAMAAATSLPVSADLEDGFASQPADVAETIRLAAGTGLAGCSVEDFTRDDSSPIYERALAVDRVAAAAEAAHAGQAGRGAGPGTAGTRLVLTARAENYLYGRQDLADTIARLQAYQEAGADVLYAPGLTGLADVREVVCSVDRPVNVLTVPGGPSVAELAEAGVRRISVGGAFMYVALGAVAAAARELRDQGTSGFLGLAREGREVARQAFGG